MDVEDILKKSLKELLKRLDVDFSKIEISEGEESTYHINIESKDPSMLIGYHGENIQALQHLLKVLAFKEHGTKHQFHIILDVDNYRQRQEENVISLAERKVEGARTTRKPQNLPPMSAYFRRKIHLHCMGAGFEDIESYSIGDGDRRHVVIKLKS